MATGGAGTASSPRTIIQPPQRNTPAPSPLAAVSPPSKREELASWWKKFRKNTEKPEEKVEIQPSGIFGVPLAESIRYANVAISLQNDEGQSFIYGYVPIVVAKCGVFLKEKATDVEGIFRLSGSAKRIKDLQTIFNSPDRFGKGLDWTGYTVHDAANILRRYLNQLPEPIVPLDFYDRFRDPLRRAQRPAQTDGEAQPIDLSVDEHATAVSAYKKLITELPPLNRQLLLYILDLLAVFASKSDLNRMTAANLAAIFQPGILSHPIHDMAPKEYRLSQDVLIFLIENQDNFLIGMSGTAVDEKTQKDVESGPPSLKSPIPVVRSTSNASAGADSLRKFGVRRNVSVSSRGSRGGGSPGVSIPGTPSGLATFPDGTTGAKISRSNTVPSKRSPAITSARFQRLNEPSGSPSPAASSPGARSTTPFAAGDGADSKSSRSNSIVPEEAANIQPLAQATESLPAATPDQVQPPPSQASGHRHQVQSDTEPTSVGKSTSSSTPFPQIVQSSQPPTTTTPGTTRERKISNLFPKSPIFGPSDAQKAQPRKLQKKQKLPGAVNDSAQSSVNSLNVDEPSNFYTPMISPDISSTTRLDPIASQQGPQLTNTAATPVTETPTIKSLGNLTSASEGQNQPGGLKPPKSPPTSTKSRSSFTDHSEVEPQDESKSDEKDKRRHRWRFSSSAKKGDNSPLVPPPPIGQNPAARGSNTSFGSAHRPRKSFTGDSQQTQSASLYGESATGQPFLAGQSSNESGDAQRDPNADTEKKGLFGKWKAKMSQTKEERQAEKDRAKSPPRLEQGASRSSLSAFAQEHLAPRGRSFDGTREEQSTRLPERAAGPEAQEEEKKSSLEMRRGGEGQPS
ncbi:hypothetical protein PV10_01313 [Exophiala mesophila]|uniref:Rho-GAP domain-containing protein n=1 Tax=Exophiala mesophila TaxID=212818 RepID=A0A0D1YAF6_EXOME|nr:uncharacterized protein PV10_01313 [Exophiala mesophila]KIV97581.1 hypothetical protein PV10_01313 [Exophiala mesophila]